MALPAGEFFSRLDAFLGALPTDFRYAVEIRNPSLLGAVDMVQKAIAQNRRSYVLVNNRSEGNAPMTVQALVDRVRA